MAQSFSGLHALPKCQSTKMRSPFLLSPWSLCTAQSWPTPGRLLYLTVNGENLPNLDQLYLVSQARHAPSLKVD